MRLNLVILGAAALALIAGCILTNYWLKTAASIGAWTDISWPNCQAVPDGLSSGIVGVTGGLNFHPNPCLRSETAQLSTYQLYINTGYPGLSYAQKYAHFPRNCLSNDEACLAYNFGYAAGEYAANYANSQGAHSAVWWLDVETENSWSDNFILNQTALQGTEDAIGHYTFLTTVGFYSYPGQWQTINSNWQPGSPAWVATGDTTYSDAIKACGQVSFTGGPIIFSQYTLGLDHDVVCQKS